MKTLIALALIFSIFIDFTDLSYDTAKADMSTNVSEALYDCSGHENEASSSEHHSDSDCHGHCHSGHSHTAIVVKAGFINNIIMIVTKGHFPAFRNKNIQNFHSQIIRPPIA